MQELFKVKGSEAWVTAAAFNVICGTNVEADSFIRVTPLVLGAYFELERVWGDVLLLRRNSAHVPTVISQAELHKMGNGFFCTFVYKEAKMYTDKIEHVWTICLLEEH